MKQKILVLLMCVVAAIGGNGQTCEFINNGDFEAGATCGIMPPTSGTIPLGAISNWKNQIGTPDIFILGSCLPSTSSLFELGTGHTRGAKETSLGVLGTLIYPPTSSVAGSHIIGLVNSQTEREAVMQHMQNSFQPNRTYTIRFFAQLGDDPFILYGNTNSNLSSVINFYSGTSTNIPNRPTSDNTTTSLQQLATASGLTPLTSIVISDPLNSWQQYTVTFTFTGTSAEDYIYFATDLQAGQNGNYTYIDDISITESPLPITGGNTVCVGNTINLQNATTGGTWTSGKTSVATVTTGGVVTGITTGFALIRYSIPNINGTNCTGVAEYMIRVNPLPNVASITGMSATAVCSQQLADATVGGVWSSTANANISATGLVTGVSTGTATITYTVTSATTGCSKSVSATVQVQSCDPCLAAAANAIPFPSPAVFGGVFYKKVYHITSDVTLSGTSYIVGSEIIIDPGVTITIPSGAWLDVGGSHFYCCNGMWKGFNVLPGGLLVIGEGKTGEATIIEDAVTAINYEFPNTPYAHSFVDLLIVRNTIFNRNQTSIRIDNYQSNYLNRTIYPFCISNCVFTSRNIDFTPGAMSWIGVEDIKQVANNATPWIKPNAPEILTAPFINNTIYSDTDPKAFLKIAGVTKKPDYGIVLNNIGVAQSMDAGIYLGRSCPFPDYSIIASETPEGGTFSNFNLFDNLGQGIIANASNFTVTNCVFQKPALGSDAYGINIFNGSNNKVTIDNGGSSGVTTYIKNCFYDMNTAILSRGYENLEINDAVFRSNRDRNITSPVGGTAIISYSNGFNDLKILNNEITNINSGMYIDNAFTNSVGNGGVMDINNNIIQAIHPSITATGNEQLSFGIMVGTGVVASNASTHKPLNILSNQINDAFCGMYVGAMKNKNFNINNNTITLSNINTTGSNYQYGIAASGGYPNTSNTIENNTITGTLEESFEQSGVYIAAQQRTAIGCNVVTGLQKGFRFANTNPGTKFWDNYMHPSNRYGFSLEANGSIGAQGKPRTLGLQDGVTSNNSWGGDNNDWLNINHFKSYVQDSWAFLSPFYLPTTSPNSWRNFDGAGDKNQFPILPYQTTNVPMNGGATNTQSLFVGYDDPNTDPNLQHCGWTIAHPPLGRESLATENEEAIANGTISLIGDEQPQMLYVLQQQLYDRLRQNQDLANNNPVLQSFLQTNSWGSFDFIYYTAQYLAQGDISSVDMLLAYFPSNNSVDDNYWQYYNWMRNMQNHPDYTPNIDDVFALANQCPATAGNVVYAVQNLYNRLTFTPHLFDNKCDNVFAGRKANNNTKRVVNNDKLKTTVQVYPNPSNGIVNVKLPLLEKGNWQLKLVDIYGKVILQKALLQNNTQLQLNLAKGMYFVNIVNANTGKQFNDKLIIE